MFSYEEIRTYNETDICIYKYILSNIDKVPYMTIRELAKEIHAPTSTILRFCNKNGFESYSGFKEALKKEAASLNTRPPLEDLQELSSFFARANSSAFEEKLLFAVECIKKADLTIFIGMGSSTLARLSDWNFSYHLSTRRVNGGYNATSQVPVLFMIEALAKRIQAPASKYFV